MTASVPEYFLTSYDALGTGVYIMEDGTYYLTAADNSHEPPTTSWPPRLHHRRRHDLRGNASMTYTMDYTFGAQTYAQPTAPATMSPAACLRRHQPLRGQGRQQRDLCLPQQLGGHSDALADENEDGENDNYVKLSMTDQMYQDTILDAADIPENDDQCP